MRIRAQQVVIAAGAIERPPMFADNDRPGTMLAGAVGTYINRFGVLPGRRMVVFTTGDSAYRTALDARTAGASVCVVDARIDPEGTLVDAARQAGIPIHDGCAIVRTRGRKAVRACEIARLNRDASAVVGESKRIACDTVAVSAGWNPVVALWGQAGGTLAWDAARGCFLPDACSPSVRSAGACNGTFELAGCLAEGASAGALAAREAGYRGGATAPPTAVSDPPGTIRPIFTVPPRDSAERYNTHFCDLQVDATLADIRLAAREGYRSVEHAKRYTTVGMGTDQGKTSNVNAVAALARIRGEPIEHLGVTTFRPPYTPTTFGAIFGQRRGTRFEPARRTPMHRWHAGNGALFRCAGRWQRPWAYLRPGEDADAAAQRETRAVRLSAGLFDASTLGRIDIQGPDAAVFLDRVYTNTWSTLQVGNCRYGLMLDEQGYVMDDGVTARLDEQHFHMTTSTGGAERVLDWLEEWLQVRWPELRVHLTDVTEQWAVAMLCGPRARELLRELTEIDLDRACFPFLSFRAGAVAGIPVRVFRISFSGELSYEINVPARYGLSLWRTLIERGKRFELCPFGTEALHVLRAERGFIVIGQETDGTVTPLDLGLEGMVACSKPDFIGKRSLALRASRQPGRLQLVGLLTRNPGFVLPQGVHLVESARRRRRPMKTLGHVTSSYMSPNLGRSIALALVEDGRQRRGATLSAHTPGGHVEPVDVCGTAFLDEQGARARS